MHFLFVQHHYGNVATSELALNLTSKGQAHQHSHRQRSESKTKATRHTARSRLMAQITAAAEQQFRRQHPEKLQTLMTAITKNKNNKTKKH